MSKKFWRLGMLAILGSCFSTLTARAEPPVFVEVVPVSFAPAGYTTGTVSYNDVRGAAAPKEGFHPIHKICDAYVARLGCAADFNQPGCGSCYSHLLFMFGSCRTFFGPLCEPAPLPALGIFHHNGPNGAQGNGGCANGSCGGGANGGCSTCGGY